MNQRQKALETYYRLMAMSAELNCTLPIRNNLIEFAGDIIRMYNISEREISTGFINPDI